MSAPTAAIRSARGRGSVLVKKISEILNLEKAFNEVLYDERHGQHFIPDILHFLESSKFRKQLLDKLKRELDTNSFQVRDLIKMDVPKDSFFLRPAARPHLEDLILYRALANHIGLKASRSLGDAVFSARFHLRNGGLIHWSEQWTKFDRAFWVSYDKGFRHVLITDITAYFININIENLRKIILSNMGKSEELPAVIEFLFQNLLKPWAQKGRNKGYGLPQGGSASTILANIYLSHVDACLTRNRDIRYLRYSDDIRVLAKNETNLKIALKTLINELMRIGLDLNEKKTQILTPFQVEPLRDPRREDMNRLSVIIGSGKTTEIEKEGLPLLWEIFRGSFDVGNAFADRHLRFTIGCFIRLRGIYAGTNKTIEEVGNKLIEKLKDMPGSANIFSRFFSVFPYNVFKRNLLRFLKS